MREDFFDPDLVNVSITISEISVSPDLANARVYTMPLGGDKCRRYFTCVKQIGALNSVACCKKSSVAANSRLRFYLDDSFENAARMSQLFASIRQGS